MKTITDQEVKLEATRQQTRELDKQIPKAQNALDAYLTEFDLVQRNAVQSAAGR